MLSSITCYTHFCLLKDAIKERENQKQKDYENRLNLEKEILNATEENAKLVAKSLQERQKLHVDIEKV